MTHLLDANALIALVVTDHDHHGRATTWAADVPFALCPVAEGALVRFLVRVGESRDTAAAVLRALLDDSRCTFWPDTISYTEVDLGHVVGHRQVTDAYLASLAAHPGGRLATVDQALATALPDHVYLIP